MARALWATASLKEVKGKALVRRTASGCEALYWDEVSKIIKVQYLHGNDMT
jgi:hypothetical protein